ncbi:MAG: ZIP family metal transporter [Candidatus Omnitrophica bacterium]|nr:ZIP family metal transporter [Candidatus Omnitrophota bacterium]
MAPLDQSSLIFLTASTGIISALATGLGAISVHFVKNNSRVVRAFASSLAAGMMISASVFSLVQEAINLKDRFPFANYIVIVGLLMGAGFYWLTKKILEKHPVESHPLAHGLSRRGILLFIAMFVHSIPEGIAIGVGFATGNMQFGLIMAMAIAVHNIPEGIAVSLPLKADGMSTPKCALMSILTSIPQPIMAVPAALLTFIFAPLLPIGLGFAGGAMLYLVLDELIPESIKDGGVTLTAWGVMLGLCGMLLISNLLNALPTF